MLSTRDLHSCLGVEQTRVFVFGGIRFSTFFWVFFAFCLSASFCFFFGFEKGPSFWGPFPFGTLPFWGPPFWGPSLLGPFPFGALPFWGPPFRGSISQTPDQPSLTVPLVSCHPTIIDQSLKHKTLSLSLSLSL